MSNDIKKSDIIEGEIVDPEMGKNLAWKEEGKLERICFERKRDELEWLVQLYNIWRTRSYRFFAKDFDEYCTNKGIVRKTLTSHKFPIIAKLAKELDGNFSILYGMPFNKIKYLVPKIDEPTGNFSGEPLNFVYEDGKIIIPGEALGGTSDDDIILDYTEDKKEEVQQAIYALIEANETRVKQGKENEIKLEKEKKDYKRQRDLFSEKLSKTEKEFDRYRLLTENLDLEPAVIKTIQDLNSLVNEFAGLIFRISPDQERLIELILDKKCEAVRLQYIGAIASISNAVRMLVANVENHYGPIEKLDSEACRNCKAAREHCERRELGCCRTCEEAPSCSSRQKCDMERVFEEHGRIYKEKMGISDDKKDENPPQSPFNKGGSQTNVRQLHKDRPTIQ